MAALAGPGRAVGYPDGARIRNTLSTMTIPWNEIRQFRIGRYQLLSAVCIVDLADGTSAHAFAIQVPNMAPNRPDVKEQRMVDELNQILEQQRLAPRPA